jgi:3-oxoacyl-[acyl-carrier protein] reductase
MKFKNRVAVVTGAARSIGQEIARHLAGHGANVVINDVDVDGGVQTAKAIEANTDAKATFIQADVSVKGEVTDLMRATINEFGRLDMFVNNAGICPVTPFFDITPEEWDRVLAVNLRGVFMCCQAAAAIMLEQRSGAIVNLASIAGRTARASSLHYSSSKAAVISLTKNLAPLLAPHVRINAVAPGPVETEMVWNMPKDVREAISKQSLFGVIAETTDIAEAVGFLLSDSARHITGHTMDVNGGQFMN